MPLVYLDRSFCIHSETCGNRDCHRNLWPEGKENAAKRKLDIAYADFKTDTCGYTQLGATIK